MEIEKKIKVSLTVLEFVDGCSEMELYQLIQMISHIKDRYKKLVKLNKKAGLEWVREMKHVADQIE